MFVVAGSKGKLTVVTQKMSVIMQLFIKKLQTDTFILIVGIANCSHHAVSGTSSQTLSSAVTVMFIPYLQQEGIITLSSLFSFVAPPNCRESCGAKLPACSFCSLESSGSAGHTDR